MMRAIPVFRSVWYKEGIKLRLPWLVLFLANALYSVWMYVGVTHLFQLDHPEIVWYRVIGLGQVHYAAIRYLPLFSALALACCQFLPETRDERLRLSLHLPADSNLTIAVHLTAGLGALFLLYACNAAFLAWLTMLHFPAQVLGTMFLTTAPWFTAGVMAYLGVTFSLLEPGLKLRVANLFVTAGLVAPLFADVRPGAFARDLPLLLLLPPCLFLAVLLPGYHFRHRRVGV